MNEKRKELRNIPTRKLLASIKKDLKQDMRLVRAASRNLKKS
jgi:hypothetical protein